MRIGTALKPARRRASASGQPPAGQPESASEPSPRWRMTPFLPGARPSSGRRRTLRFAREERRDVGALLRIAEAEAHLLARDQRFRVGEPALDERLGPHDGGAAQ